MAPVRRAAAAADASFQRWLGISAEREALTVWALCFGATLIAYVASPPAGKVAATVGFLYLPLYACQRRGEDWPDFGLSRARLGADIKQFLGVAAVVFPLFIAGYFADRAIDKMQEVAETVFGAPGRKDPVKPRSK